MLLVLSLLRVAPQILAQKIPDFFFLTWARTQKLLSVALEVSVKHKFEVCIFFS